MKLTKKEMTLATIGILGSMAGCIYCIVILAAYFNLRTISELDLLTMPSKLNQREVCQ